MNNIATIELVERFTKVSYYTLWLNDDSSSLFDQFIAKHTHENREKLNHILVWIKIIGEKIGAKATYFRNEAKSADTSALPPIGVDREPTYVEYNEATGKVENAPNNLRLYCLRANEHVVFLFNGDVKTAARAQECEKVRSHFRLANKLTKAIDMAFRTGELQWDRHNEDIILDADFELIIE